MKMKIYVLDYAKYWQVTEMINDHWKCVSL